ncbi:two-component regulator propeller domain-containing protein [Arcticibacter sp.]|uniref:hybrid sensor histidine kinase/response regulator transcription factor n=1 Tax=Arcticibacter sp. TaxID=1872630 RepID=UPI00388D7611
MNVRTIISFNFVFALCLLFCQAQETANFHFRTLRVEDGLSENAVYAVIQDTDGFMWIATKDGLNRFDGSSFRTFRRETGKTGTLGNNFVRCLAEKDDNSLYIGTDDGVFIMNKLDESFRPLEGKMPEKRILSGAITALIVDQKGKLWIGTMARGIYLYDPASKDLSKVKMESGAPTSNVCWSLLEDRSGIIWAGTARGLLRYSRHSEHFEIEKQMFSRVENNKHEILSMHEDRRGNLWLGTWSEGLRCYNKQTGDYREYMHAKPSTYVSHIRAISEYKKDQLLIGADDGLYLFSITTGTYGRVDIPGFRYSLSDQNIYSIAKDAEGGIWVGTYFGGVNYLSSSQSAIETFHPGPEHGLLSGKAVSQFCEDAKGNMWIATEDGGINYLDIKTRAITQPVKTTYHNTHALLLDGEELWIGTFSRGIDIYNIRTKKLTNLQFDPNNQNTLNHDCIFSIYKTRGGDILIGTYSGLNKYDKHSKKFVRIKEVKGFIYDIKEDNDGNLWLASYGGGAIRYSYKSRKWIQYDLLKKDSKDPIVGSKLTGILIDSQKRPVFASEGRGIFIYNKANDTFRNISEADGLPNNVIYGVLEDPAGDLWLSCNKGLICLDPDKPRSGKLYNIDDGLQSNQFNYKSSFISREGKFYFGGVNGFSSFYPQDLKALKNRKVPKVAITDIRLLGDTKPSLQMDIQENLNRLKKIRLKHNNSSFRIHFVSLSYVSPRKNEYSYKLDGVDKKWNYVGNNQSVTYVNLPPGDYTFMVRGSNNDQLWNGTPSSVSISVLPPFWQSTYARIAYFVLFAGVFILFLRNYEKRNKARQARQLEVFKSDQETKSFQSKIDFFTSIAHEIRTPLSLINAPLEEVLSTKLSKQEELQNLSIIEKHCERLKILVNQLLDFRKIDSINYQMETERFDLIELLKELYLRFRKTADIDRIRLSIEMPAVEHVFVESDKEAITKIVSNLLSNALKFTHDEVVLQLVCPPDASYTIIVRDNGEGIPDELKELIFDPFFQIQAKTNLVGTGIGLSLVKHLSALLDAKIEVMDAPKGGTSFHFTLVSLPQSRQPVLMKSNRNASKEALPLNTHSPYRILIVEDNEDMANFLRSSLMHDYMTDAVYNAQNALKMLEDANYNLIISDIMMPGMDGISFAKKIKTDQNYSHIPVILLSAKIDNMSKAEGLSSGADVFIEKPFSILHLKSQISSLLQNRKNLLELFNKSPFSSYSTLVTNKSDDAFLTRINEEIESHLSDEQFSVESLAEILTMSRSNLQRKLKAISGQTPGDYLRNYRLRKAAVLLLEPNSRINEVAFNTGFSSASYFTKAFFKYHNMSPSEFIKQHEVLVPS